MKNPKTSKTYYPCQDIGDGTGEIKAYVNSTQKEIYFEISYIEGYPIPYTVLDADTAEELAKDLLKMVKEMRK